MVMVSQFTSLLVGIANFAIFHNPTPDDNSWPMYGTNGHTYVRLDNSEINTSHNPQVDERMNFWKKMFEINI